MDMVWTIPDAVEDAAIMATPFPAGRVALETSALVLLAFATAAVLSRTTENDPGKFAAPILLGVYAVSWMIPEMSNPWPYPSDERWPTAANWWWVALGTGLTMAILFSPDSQRRAGGLRWLSIERPSRERVRRDDQEREMARNKNQL
jgi:hypothetical protein